MKTLKTVTFQDPETFNKNRGELVSILGVNQIALEKGEGVSLQYFANVFNVPVESICKKSLVGLAGSVSKAFQNNQIIVVGLV